MKAPPRPVAASVRAELRAADLTQERVGAVLGIDQAAVSRRYRGITLWRADELVLLSETFEIPLDRLYRSERTPSIEQPAARAS